MKPHVDDNERFRLILKLAVSGEEDHEKNSVIAFMKISEKTYRKNIRKYTRENRFFTSRNNSSIMHITIKRLFEVERQCRHAPSQEGYKKCRDRRTCQIAKHWEAEWIGRYSDENYI